MKLIVSGKGCDYEIIDKNDQRKLYSVKKKSFAQGVYLLRDKNNYKLYTFTQQKTIDKPAFTVCHQNDDEIMKFVCKSNTGELVLSVIGYDINGNAFNYVASSEDQYHFTIKSEEEVLGTIEVIFTLKNTVQYVMEFDDERYDDYISLFPVAVDMSFGHIYNEK